MDRNDVKRRALLGAAKVAFSATLAACGGVVVVENEAGGANGGSNGGPTGSGGESAGHVIGTIQPIPWATTGSTTDASSGTDAPSKCVGVYGNINMPCCDSLLEATFPDNAPTPSPVSADVVACCNGEMQAKVSVTSGGSALPYSVLYRCCSVPGVTKQPSTCTPWGPPVPPRMPHDLGWLEEAA